MNEAATSNSHPRHPNPIARPCPTPIARPSLNLIARSPRSLHWHRRKTAHELPESPHPLIKTLRPRNEVEVVDAAVLLHHPDVELLRDAVELGGHHGVH